MLLYKALQSNTKKQTYIYIYINKIVCSSCTCVQVQGVPALVDVMCILQHRLHLLLG